MRTLPLRFLAMLTGSLAVLAIACAPAASSPTAGTAQAGDKPAGKAGVTLRAISSWEKSITYAQPLNMFIDRVNEKTNGELQITFAGPEVVPPFEAMTAVTNGVYDLTHTSPSFYGTVLPEGNAIQFAVGDCKKYRDAGAIPLLDQIHREKTNTMLLGCSGGGHGFVFLTKDPVENLDYFKGKKMRTTALYTPILQALGASPVEVAPAEVYTALERKVVDGVAWPEMGIRERKLQEVLKYMVKPTWLEVRETMVMNVNSFNKLPPHLQKALQETALEMENEYDAFFRQTGQKEQAELQQEGIQIITLPKAEGDKLQQVVRDATWDTIVRNSPEWGPKLREAFTKAAAN